jgi:dienelactone hydrolase
MKSETIIEGANGKPILIDITHNEAKSPLPVILYAHGFNGFKDWGNFDLIAQQFLDAGFTFIKFNFSHNGTSPSHPQEFVNLEAFAENNYTKELEDLDFVLNWITDKENPFAAYIQADNVGLVGHSMGGGISILKASEDARVGALATWASISQCKTPWGSWPEDKMAEWKKSNVAYYYNGRTKQQMPMHYQLFEDYKNNEERLNILKAAAKIKVPFLICHGLEDTSVSMESAYEIHKANEMSELLIVPSDHVFGRKHPWVESELPKEMQVVVDSCVKFFKSALI